MAHQRKRRRRCRRAHLTKHQASALADYAASISTTVDNLVDAVPAMLTALEELKSQCSACNLGFGTTCYVGSCVAARKAIGQARGMIGRGAR